MSTKRATADGIGAHVTYLPTGATGTITDILPGRYFDTLVIETDAGLTMHRSVEDCAIAAAAIEVQVYDVVELVDFTDTAIVTVLGLFRDGSVWVYDEAHDEHMTVDAVYIQRVLPALAEVA